MSKSTGGSSTATEQIARQVHGLCVSLRNDIVQQCDALMGQWAPHVERPEFMASARNLACYLGLRRADLHALQPRLSEFGLSSLGRSEPNVMACIDAVIASLARIAGLPETPYPHADDFRSGAALLAERQSQVFGADTSGPYTRIMVTLPSEAASEPSMVHDLIVAGADCMRINCAHDGADAWQAMIQHTRKAAKTLGRDVRVQMDLGGPKFRIEAVHAPEKERLFKGDHFIIANRPSAKPSHPEVILSHEVLLAHLLPGTFASIDDGKLQARVVSRDGERVRLEVTKARHKGVKLKPEKGVNLPGAELHVAALTEEDIANLDFVAAHADIVGFSFVQTPEDVRSLACELKRRMASKPLPALMLKIETPLAVRNLPRLIVQAGGLMPVAVMIARGDLAVEIGFERLSEIQEEILWLCEAAHVPVVWATQVLETMVKDGIATRAETTDAAMSQRAECVMLNKGPYLAEAVSFLDGVLRRMDRHQSKKRARLRALQSWKGPQTL